MPLLLLRRFFGGDLSPESSSDSPSESSREKSILLGRKRDNEAELLSLTEDRELRQTEPSLAEDRDLRKTEPSLADEEDRDRRKLLEDGVRACGGGVVGGGGGGGGV